MVIPAMQAVCQHIMDTATRLANTTPGPVR
jgi:hypothetical protein